MEVLGGSFRLPWNCSGGSRSLLGGPHGVLRGAGGVLGVSLGSWSCSSEAWDVARASFEGSWSPCDVLWGSCGVLGSCLGDLVGDLVVDLGPHVLCAPMFQRFTLFLVECVLGGSWNVLGGALAYFGRSLLGAMRLQKFPWETCWATPREA